MNMPQYFFGNHIIYIALNDDVLLCLGAVWAEALKMETACFSEMLASTYQPTQCLNPEEHHHCRHFRENLKSHIAVVT
jgi:hypothetical protein